MHNQSILADLAQVNANITGMSLEPKTFSPQEMNYLVVVSLVFMEGGGLTVYSETGCL